MENIPARKIEIIFNAEGKAIQAVMYKMKNNQWEFDDFIVVEFLAGAFGPGREEAPKHRQEKICMK